MLLHTYEPRQFHRTWYGASRSIDCGVIQHRQELMCLAAISVWTRLAYDHVGAYRWAKTIPYSLRWRMERIGWVATELQHPQKSRCPTGISTRIWWGNDHASAHLCFMSDRCKLYGYMKAFAVWMNCNSLLNGCVYNVNSVGPWN